MWLLCLSLAKTFFGPQSLQAKAVKARLGAASSWGLDKDLLATAAGVLGLALQPSGSGSEGEGEGEGEEEEEGFQDVGSGSEAEAEAGGQEGSQGLPT